jgi:transposase-like protein
MPKRKSVQTEELHSPEFKLRVVLELIRSPKRRKRICQENKISEELLVQWHQEFVSRAQLIFSDSPSPAPRTQIGSLHIFPQKKNLSPTLCALDNR